MILDQQIDDDLRHTTATMELNKVTKQLMRSICKQYEMVIKTLLHAFMEIHKFFDSFYVCLLC